ncbi:MAG: transporter substrate-binding domain-containing protein [Poseidonibacter sp.]
MIKYILILFLFLNTFINANNTTEKITVLLPSNFLPYITIKDGQPSGLSIDIFKNISEIAGIEYEFIVKPTFTSAEEAFRDKRADILLINGITEQRKQSRNFTTAYSSSKILAYKLSSNDINSLDNILSKNLILKTNNAANKLFKNHPKNKLTFVNSKEEAIVNLISQKGDIFIINEAPMREMLKLVHLDEAIVPFGKPIREVPIAIGVQKDKLELVKKLDDALKEFMQTEKFKIIYNHYNTKSLNTNKIVLSLEEKKYLNNNTFTICERHGLYPISDIKDGRVVGIMGDYLDEIVKSTGLKLKVLDSNSIQEFKQNIIQNKCDMFGIKAKGTKVLPTLIGTNIIFEFPYTVMGELQSFNMDSNSDLSDHTFIVRFASVKKRILNVFPKLNIKIIEDIDTALSKTKDKVHFIGTKPVIERIIQKYGFDKFKINGVLDNVNQQLTMGVHEQHPMLLSIINKAISNFDPLVLNQIKDKYSIKQFKIEENHNIFFIYILIFLAVLIIIIYLRSKAKIALVNLQKAKELNEQKKILIQAQKIANIGSWEERFDDKSLHWSKEVYSIFEYDSNEDISFEKFINRVHPDDREIVSRTFQSSIKKQKLYFIEHRLLFSDGRIKYVIERAEHYFNKSNQHVHTIGTVQDITKRKEREEKLKKQTELLEDREKVLETIIQENPHPMILHKEGGEIILMNRAWVKSSGFTLEDTPTITDWINLAYEDKEIKINLAKHINSLYKITETINEGEFTFINKNKESVIWQVSSSPLGVIDGQRTLITSAMDITEMKAKEEILFQQSKMAAMGEMLGNIAHQWRQPLSTISTAATGCKVQKEMDCLSEEQLKSALTAINDSAQYLSQTIDDFRGFFNPKNNKFDETNISKIFQKTLKLVDAQFIAKEIKIIQNIEEYGLFTIENEMVQVLINILNNSKDALLTKKNQQRLIFINTYKKEHTYYIEILDNAGGVPEDIINRIFEPYFTTKHQSTGTGIGLYMSEEIIKNHLNGILSVENETFVFDKIKYTGAKFSIKIDI